MYDLLGTERVDRDRIKNIALLGVNTFGWTFACRSLEIPPKAPYVRLTAPSRSMMGMVGRFEGPAEHGFLFQPTGGTETLVVPYDAVTRLEVRRRHSNAGAGAVLGGLLGAAFGAVAAATSTCDSATRWCIGPSGDELVPVAIVVFGGAGAGLGATHSEGWRSVPLRREGARAEVMISPASRGGIRVGWTLHL